MSNGYENPQEKVDDAFRFLDAEVVGGQPVQNLKSRADNIIDDLLGIMAVWIQGLEYPSYEDEGEEEDVESLIGESMCILSDLQEFVDPDSPCDIHVKELVSEVFMKLGRAKELVEDGE